MNRVALINMPWASIERASIALGILKRVLRREKVAADVFYLNLKLAKRIDLKVYNEFTGSILFGEWIFSQHLFGEHGTGELKTTYADISSGRVSLSDSDRRTFRRFTNDLKVDFDQLNKEVISPFIEECLDSIEWSKYSVVGFTSVFAQQLASLLLAKRIKQLYPHIKIVFGGANVEGDMGREALRAFDWIDYVVDGEGEISFPHLVKNILNHTPHEPVPGVSMRVGDQVINHTSSPPMFRMDQAPVPDYVDYFKELKRCGLEKKINPPLLFESSRGCWWGEKAHCTFCGLNGQTMKYRAKSADKIERELMTQSRRYKSFTIEAVDNILDMESFKDLLPRLADKGFDWAFFYEVKSSLNRNQVDLLKAAGVACIQPGIESLSTEVLKLMRKGVTAIQNIQLLKWGRENKIFIAWNLLYGFPGEKKEYYDEMLEVIPSITHLQPPTVVPRIVLERFSPYHFDAERLGIRNIKPAAMYRHIYPEWKVNLSDIAYFFEYTLDESVEDPKEYIKPVSKAVADWKSAYFKTPISFQYRKGPGFIELQDNRPMDAEEVGSLRKSLLKGIESDVYLLCDSIKSFREINDFVKLRTTPSWSDDQVRQLLEGFVEKRLMIEEKGRYLALATAARQKKKARVGISQHVVAQASKAIEARTLKVLEVVAGTSQCCSDQAEGAVNLIQPSEIEYTRQSL